MKKIEARNVYLAFSLLSGLILSTVFSANQLYRVQTVGLDALQLVLVGTILEVTAFLFEIPTGLVADIYSRRLSVIIGVFLFGLGFLVEGSIPVFASVLGAQIIWGMGWTFISGAREAWITDEVGADNVGPIFLRGTQFNQWGNLLGIPLFVVLGGFSYRLPIMVGGGLYLILGLFLIAYMPEDGFQPTPKSERENWGAVLETFQKGYKLTRKTPVLMSFVGIAIFVGLYSEGYDRLSEAHFLNNFNFPTLPGFEDPVVPWFGIMRLGTILMILALTEFVKRQVNTREDVKIVWVLQACYALISVGIFTFARSRNFTLALLSTWLVNISRALTFPLNNAWINKHIETKVRATVLSMTNQVDALGQIAGGPIVGMVGRWRSIRAALTTSALILLPVLPLFQRVLKGAKGKSTQQEASI